MLRLRSKIHDAQRPPCRTCAPAAPPATVGQYPGSEPVPPFPAGAMLAMLFTWGLLAIAVWGTATGRYKRIPGLGDPIPDLET